MTNYTVCPICGYSTPDNTGEGAVGTKHYEVEHQLHEEFCMIYQKREGLLPESTGNCGDCRNAYRPGNAGSLCCAAAEDELPCQMPHWERGENTCGDYEKKCC